MTRYQLIGASALAACLQACGVAPARPPLTVQPLLRIDDARAARAAPPRGAAAAATASAAAAAPAPAAGAIPVQPSRMEIVQLGPNEFRLQYRQPVAGASAAAPAAATARQLQIVNGNGVAGMGERVRCLLAGHGIGDASVVNQRRHYQRLTIIEYLPDQQQRAHAVLAALQGRARLLPARALPGALTLRLVLGRDQARAIGALAAAGTGQATDQLADTTDTATLLALGSPAAPHINQE